MLIVKKRQPEEVLLEKKLRNPIAIPDDQNKPRYDFFKTKMQELIDYHLDYAKFNKKIITEEDLEKIQKYEEVEVPKRIIHKKSKSMQVELTAEPKQLRDSLLLKISSFEKIIALVRSSERLVKSIENLENLDALPSKLTSLASTLTSISSISDQEINNFHYLLTLLDTFTQKSSSELVSSKKLLQEKHEKEKNSIQEKYENKLRALLEHNKVLSSHKKENKIIAGLNERVQSLEKLLTESDKQVIDKIDLAKQRSSEIHSLNSVISSKNEEISRLKKDLKDLEEVNNLDRNKYRDEIYELNNEISRFKSINEESVLANEMKMNELHYLAESHKYRLEQALQELDKADQQIEHLRLEFNEREAALETENFELRKEIERLDRITFGLKDDVESANKELEIKQLQMSKSKDDEIGQLSKLIEKLEIENGTLMKSNKELSVINHKIENELWKSKEKKEAKAKSKDGKSEKKVKKNK